MKKIVTAVTTACMAVSFCGGAAACDMFNGVKDANVTQAEWNKAFAFDYTKYQVDASFTPTGDAEETQRAELKKDGDIMCSRLIGEDEDGEYDYSVYAAKLGNDYKKYEKDETGTWHAKKITKASYQEFHVSAIFGQLLGEISYSSFTYDPVEYVYSYTQALPTGETAATYTFGFLDNRLVEMNIEINAAPVAFTFMGMEIELQAGTLAFSFAYENEELILPTVTSPGAYDTEVTEEEWKNALTLWGCENVQVEALQDDVRMGRIVKDGNKIHIPNTESFADEEGYWEIDEEGNVFKEYYKDETGTWYMTDPVSGFNPMFFFNLGAADYSLFTYDDEEGVYSYTADGPLFSVVGPDGERPDYSDSGITTTIDFRFLNKKLVEMRIKSGTEQDSDESVFKYTYNDEKLTLPTVGGNNEVEPNEPSETDTEVTEAQWEKALTLLDYENIRCVGLISDGSVRKIIKNGDVIYMATVGLNRTSEVYYSKDGDLYTMVYKDSETDDWTVTEISERDYESIEDRYDLNFNVFFSYKDFTYDEDRRAYCRESETQTTTLYFWSARLMEIYIDGEMCMYLSYYDEELMLPTVGGDNEVDPEEPSEPDSPTVGELILSYELLDDNTYAVVAAELNGNTEIVIPDTYNDLPVTSIGNRAFYNCNSLTSVVIPDSVTSIGEYAFSRCENLTEIVIPDSVTTIDSFAFGFCFHLTRVTIGSNVTYIWGGAFSECFSLVEVYNKSSLEITKGSAEYGYVARLAKSVYTDPNESKLFTDADGYIVYTDGDLVSLIGYKGTKKNLELPDGITEINQCAFYRSNKLKSVYIPNSVTSIGDSAFYGCDNLTSITVSVNNTAYQSIDGNLYNKDGTALVQYAIGKTATEFVVSNSVTSIGDQAFTGCESLTSVIFRENSQLTSIGHEAFTYCENLTEIVIPNSVTNIGQWAFANCNSLEIVYYTGTEEEWIALQENIGNYNEKLIAARIYYLKDTEVAQAEWNVAFAFDYTNYQYQQTVETEFGTVTKEVIKNGDIICVIEKNATEIKTEYYEKDGEVYKKYCKDTATEAWRIIQISEEDYNAVLFVSDDILYGEFSYADEKYYNENCVLQFLDNKLVKMVIDSGTEVVTWIFTYGDVEASLPIKSPKVLNESSMSTPILPEYMIKNAIYTLDPVFAYEYTTTGLMASVAQVYMSEDGEEYKKIDYNEFTVTANTQVQFKYICGEMVTYSNIPVVDVTFDDRSLLHMECYFHPESEWIEQTFSSDGLHFETLATNATLKYINVISLSNFSMVFTVENVEVFTITLIDYYDRENAIIIHYINQGGQTAISVNDGEVVSLDDRFSGPHYLHYNKNGFVADGKTYPYAWNGTFTSDKMLLHVTLEGVVGDAHLNIESLNGQHFDKLYDNNKGQWGIGISTSTVYVCEEETVVTIPCAQATDVLTPYVQSGLTIEVLDSEGNHVTSLDGVLLNGKCAVDREYQIRLEGYEWYEVRYTYTDQNGNKSRCTLLFSVRNYWYYDENGVPAICGYTKE